MQAKLADMYVTLSAARAYVYAVTRLRSWAHHAQDAAGAILYAAERRPDGAAGNQCPWRQQLYERLSDRPALARRQAGGKSAPDERNPALAHRRELFEETS